MEIGLFQLENLLYTHTRFCFLDLRESTTAGTANPSMEQILARAVKVVSNKVETHLKDTQVAKDAPIVLVCENGRTSAAVSQQLEKLGYANVYVAEGGVEALLLEL